MLTLRSAVLSLVGLAGTATLMHGNVASAQEPQEAIVFLPPAGDNVPAGELGLLMHARAEQMLVEGGALAVVDLRHVLQAAEAMELAPSSWWGGGGAERIGRLLGASRVIAGRLHLAAAGYTLELEVVEKGVKGSARTQVLPASLGAAVEAGARALAQLASPAVKLPAAGDTFPPDSAVVHFAACHAALLKQPIVLESPSLLRGPELSQAVAECSAALEAAPGYDEARSALGFALAISDRPKDAAAAIVKLPTTVYDPELFLTHYWLATRYRSLDDGLAILREEVRRHPASLLARGYLAEHLFLTRRYEESLVEWKRIHELAPRAPHPYARMSAALARLKRHDEAIASAREIARLLPAEPGTAMILGARYVDAGRYDEAIATLRPITEKNGRPEPIERIGWAWLRKGMIGKSRADFQQAFEAAGRTASGWRTRGRALGGLIAVAAAAKDEPSVREWVRRAQQEDFVPFLRALQDPAITAVLNQAEQEKSPEPGAVPKRAPRIIPPEEATPFPLDPAGEVDPSARNYPSVPSFLEVLSF